MVLCISPGPNNVRKIIRRQLKIILIVNFNTFPSFYETPISVFCT